MKLAKTLTLAFVAALLTAPAFAADLTVVSWGGALQDAQTKAFMDPFAKATGTKIIQDSWSGELAKLRAMVDSGNVPWDVIDMDPQTAATACEQGLLEPIGTSAMAEAAVVPGALIDCAVGTSTYATILAYKKDAFDSAPVSVTDIFDTQKFPGKRSFRKSPVDTLEVALMADGVAPGDVYDVLSTPEGVKRAFAKLDTIKDDIVWWEAGAQPAQLLMSGEVVMSLAWNGRITDANANESADLGMAWANQVRGFDMWTVPVGAKNMETALDFITSTIEPETNAALAQYIAYGPTAEGAAGFVDPATLAELPSAPANSTDALAQDGSFWAANSDAIGTEFTAWVSQ